MSRRLHQWGLRTTALAAVSALVASAAPALAGASGPSRAGGDENCVDEVTIGTVWPQSGPFAFAGQASLIGAGVALDEINEAGGIASLCGATVSLASVDAGASAEDAASAVEGLLSKHEDVPIIVGSWLSSLTLAATEISEREGIPWVSDSFADEVTERSGFSHVYSIAPPSSLIKDLLLQAVEEGFETAGITIEKVALVGDNTAAAVALQDALKSEFADRGVDVAVAEQWAPGLDDASGIATKIKSADVDAVFLISYAFADVQLVVSSLLARGVTAPIIQNGGQGLLPAWRELGDAIVGMSTFVTANPVKGGEEIAAKLAEAAGEDYANQDHLVGYELIQVAAAAIEAAGSTDREVINEVLQTTTFSGPEVVRAVATTEIAFGEGGRIAQPFGVLAQWQEVDGELVPCTVWPAEFAVCEPAWGTGG